MTFNRDNQLADLISARAVDPTLAQPSWATAEEWDTVGRLAAIERELRHGAVAPDLRDDPVAAMLGLIPDPDAQLDGAALTRLRKAARLSVGDLASRLRNRAWDVTQREVFQWENQSVVNVSPAMIEAMAAILGVPAARLTTAHAPIATQLDVTTPRFQVLATRLSEVLRISLDQATSRLSSVAVVSVHRGNKPREAQLLDTLEAYVRAMESRSES